MSGANGLKVLAQTKDNNKMAIDNDRITTVKFGGKVKTYSLSCTPVWVAI